MVICIIQKYISYKEKGEIEEKGSMRIPLFIENLLPNYSDYYMVLLTDLFGHKSYMNSPSIDDEEFEISLKQFREKKNDIINFKRDVIKQIDGFIPEGEKLIDTYHPDESELYLNKFYKKIKKARTEVEKWETDISEPQKQQMCYFS